MIDSRKKEKMKIIIAGPRDFNNYKVLCEAIEKSNINQKITEIVSGKARGVDTLGEKWAKENNINIKEFPAKWDDMSEPCNIKINKYGKKYNSLAGFNRNKQMAEYADGLIAISAGTPGTENMIKTMSNMNKFVFVYFIDNIERKK